MYVCVKVDVVVQCAALDVAGVAEVLEASSVVSQPASQPDSIHYPFLTASPPPLPRLTHINLQVNLHCSGPFFPTDLQYSFGIQLPAQNYYAGQ